MRRCGPAALAAASTTMDHHSLPSPLWKIMIRRFNPAVATALALVLNMPAAQAAYPGVMKAFASAESGMTRLTLYLPPQQNESDWRVELLVGKMVQVDTVNRYFFGGTLETETIAGWGFQQYVLRQLGPLAGTLMAVDPDRPKVDRFVTLSGPPALLRYNSRLPVVVYAPKDVEVRYRIWTAGGEKKAIAKG